VRGWPDTKFSVPLRGPNGGHLYLPLPFGRASASASGEAAAVAVCQRALNLVCLGPKKSCLIGVGEVGLRKHHPRPATLATFGLRTASVSWGNFRCTGSNKTLMPLMPCEFCCAGMIPRGGAYLRCRRYGWPCSGDEGPRGPGTRRAGRGHRVRGQWRRGQGVRRGATPPVQDRYFGAEGAVILDTWLPPTCKVGSGRGRDKGGHV
jgi:hypothetical protein